MGGARTTAGRSYRRRCRGLTLDVEAVEGDGDEDGPRRPRTKWTTLEGPCTGQLLREVSISESESVKAVSCERTRAVSCERTRAVSCKRTRAGI